MRYLILLFLLVIFFACGNDNASAKMPDVLTPEPPVEEPARELSEDEQIDLIRDEYEATVREMQADVLEKDSIAYDCDEASGQFLFYTDPETKNVRIVINSYALGDHYGLTEYWYFNDEEEPFFLFRESGSWQFGGQMTEDEAGNLIPGTIDKIREERFYFADGMLIRNLVKAYEIKSWEENPDATTIPNETVAHNGEKPASFTWVSAVLESGKVDCEAILVE